MKKYIEIEHVWELRDLYDSLELAELYGVKKEIIENQIEEKINFIENNLKVVN